MLTRGQRFLGVYLLLTCCLVFPSSISSTSPFRGALIVTLSGSRKLSEYFEWSCRSIGASSSLFDMLVFHEGNSALSKVHCAKNVKFIDLGHNGLSKLIVDEVTRNTNTSETSRMELTSLLADIVTHIPRYLVEPKPVFGTLFRDYLTKYTHWSYTDPDIVWGNLADWLDPADLGAYDIITLAKTYDAGRLFIRGQFALHKNVPTLNDLWRGLDYLQIQNFALRIGNAARMVREGRPSEAIFGANFKSAEGLYSQLVFQYQGGSSPNSLSRSLRRQPVAAALRGSAAAAEAVLAARGGISVKIVGRGVDDYSREPVVVFGGKLYRCSLSELADGCATEITSSPSNLTIRTLPKFAPLEASAVFDKSACRMQWLPESVRYCIAQRAYGGGGGRRREGPATTSARWRGSSRAKFLFSCCKFK